MGYFEKDGNFITLSSDSNYREELKKRGMNPDDYIDARFCYYEKKAQDWVYKIRKRCIPAASNHIITEFNDEFSRVYPIHDFLIYVDDVSNKLLLAKNPDRSVTYPNEFSVDAKKIEAALQNPEDELLPMLQNITKRLKRRKPTRQPLEFDKEYLLTEDITLGHYDIKKGAVISLEYQGTGWNNHTIIKFKSGKIRTNTHSNYLRTKDKSNRLNYNGKQEFLSIDELSEKLGTTPENLIISFDPYKVEFRLLPVKNITVELD